jgi:tRNA nucleotidyltransferase (CCA-adding enzyme)
VRRIAARLEEAGHETWCVGGAVRDALLGRPHADWDLATAAPPEEVRRLFKRTVPLGIEFGTVGVLDADGVMHEVTTFRRDVRTDGRHAVVEYGVSLDDDLARRDFTINAIAFNSATDEVRDPFGGRLDLELGVVRAVGDAPSRMREDRLRALRALRFAGRFQFVIDPATWSAIEESAPHLPRLSRERVRQEIEKTMDQVRCPSRSFALWRRAGAFDSLLPEFAGVSDAGLHAPDFVGTPDDTSRIELASSRRRNRIAALLLELGPRDARRVLEGLRASNREVDWVSHLVDCWARLGGVVRQAAERGDAAASDLRRWVAATGRSEWRDFLRVAQARWRADGATPGRASLFGLHRRGIRTAYRDPIAMGDLAVDGSDLMEIGIAPGPRLGALLKHLLDAVLEDPALNQREALLAIARKQEGRGA